MKSRYFMAGGLGLIILILWLFVLVTPTLRQHHHLTDQLETAEKSRLDYHRTLQEVPELVRRYKNLIKSGASGRSHLVSREEIDRLLKSIRTTAGSHNLTLKEITPSLEELLELSHRHLDDSTPPILNITVDFKGTLANGGRFIEDIERSSCYRRVSRCLISNTGEKAVLSDITYSFEAVLESELTEL